MARKAGSPIIVPEVFRHAFLAGLGAFSSGVEEAQSTYERWMKKGEETQKEWEKRLGDVRSRLTRRNLEKALKDVRSRILESSGDIRARAKAARSQARKQIQKGLSTVGLAPEKGQGKAAEKAAV